MAALSRKSAQFGSALLAIGCISLAFLLVCVTAEEDKKFPTGHLQRLGSHRPREGPVEELTEVPHPLDFFDRYAKPAVPVIFKGAAKSMPAYKLWTDAYLKKKSGRVSVGIEPGKKENRTRVALEGSQTTFGEFLDMYNGTDIYMVDSLPKPLEGDYNLLPCLLCGGYTDFLSMANFWFSSGGTKSVLHNDDADNLNCVISGDKEFFMADKVYENTLPFTKSGHVELDVDAVDLTKVPEMMEVKWWQAFVKEGDCLFIPHHWLHQVRSSGRNLAVNIWWHHMRKLNRSDCFVDGKEELGRKPLPDSAAFSNFKIEVGNSHRSAFLDMLGEEKKGYLTAKRIQEFVTEMLAQNEEELSKKELKRQIKAVMRTVDKDGNKKITEEEIYAVPAQFFEDMFGEPDTGYNIEQVAQIDDRKRRRANKDDNEATEEGREEDEEYDGQGEETRGSGEEDGDQGEETPREADEEEENWEPLDLVDEDEKTLHTEL